MLGMKNAGKEKEGEREKKIVDWLSLLYTHCYLFSNSIGARQMQMKRTIFPLCVRDVIWCFECTLNSNRRTNLEEEYEKW